MEGTVLEMRPQDPERLRKFSRSHSDRELQDSLQVQQGGDSFRKIWPSGKEGIKWEQGTRV